MLAQRSALSSLFNDDPFFSQESLWPSTSGALSQLQEDFFHRGPKMSEGFLRELGDDPQHFTRLPLIPSFARLQDDEDQQKETKRTALQSRTPQNTDAHGNLLVTLDARGYAPSDITVKLKDRSIVVVAQKKAVAEESQSSSSSSSSMSSCSVASCQMGFTRKIDLPQNLDLSALSCSLMDNGQLCISAPAATQAKEEEHEVPTRFRSSLEFPISSDKTDV
ncbi:heat shock protein beta-9 [Neosynchiropus ocellatus]